MRAPLLLASIIATAACMPPSWGAAALLHPARRPVPVEPACPHRAVEVVGDGGVVLRGWLFPAAAPRTGVTVVYLHGVGDNRASGTWLAEHLVAKGHDVLALDARAHGASGGAACTYGYYEKRDLACALSALHVERAVLVGVSLGAATALQAAPEDRRIAGVVAVAPFSDLETVARERAPWFVSGGQLRAALALAEREAGFRAVEVSPAASAARIAVPVLLVHGGADRETPPDHSRRVYAALHGSRTLRLVEGAGHSDALGKAWPEVERWIDAVAAGSPAP